MKKMVKLQPKFLFLKPIPLALKFFDPRKIVPKTKYFLTAPFDFGKVFKDIN